MGRARETKAAIMIDRRPSEVFAALTNFAGWPTWQGRLKKTERISIGPLRIGSKIRLIQPRSVSQLEITQIMPNELFAVRAADGRQTWESHFSLQAVHGGTWLKQSYVARGSGLRGALDALLNRWRLKRNLARLKRTLEHG